jgi:hypothetical protein
MDGDDLTAQPAVCSARCPRRAGGRSRPAPPGPEGG